jgi:HAD superfamily hydrolase (TIGR01509 family)
MLRAIVFDFDGVLANTEPLHLRAYQDVLAAEGVTLTEADYYSRYLGFDDAAAFAAMGADAGRHWSASEMARLMATKARRVEQLERDVSMLFPGAAAAVRRAAAHVPIAVASGALRVEIIRVLEREQLMNCFSAIVAAEDTSSGKPSPAPYQCALVRLSSQLSHALDPYECVALEDSPWGLESARAAGLRTVAVAQTYQEPDLRSADLVIPSIDALDIQQLAHLCDS